jgi:hypothetical protein
MLNTSTIIESPKNGYANDLVAANGVDAAAARITNYRLATVLAFVLSVVFLLIGLLVPPSLSHDAGWGMQEWRTLLVGGPVNSVVSPDPADISQDQAIHITWWSPGQYMVPGVLTFLGIRLGTALTFATGLSLLGCLLGWIQVAKYFLLSPRTTMLVVIFIATFRYSTLPFGIYNGGEVLLQGLAPWLILIGCKVPSMSLLRAAGLVCVVIWLAFFVKLTGLIVVCAALFAGGLEALIRLRAITRGMVGSAIGALLAFVGLYLAWFSRGSTPASGTGWSFRFADVFFAIAAPWGAGLSWGDMLTTFLRRSTLNATVEGQLPTVFLFLLLVPVIPFLTVLVKGKQQWNDNANLKRLSLITATFYIVCSVVMTGIILHGGDVSLEERHLRAGGTLILVAVLAVASRQPTKSLSRMAVGALCVLLSLFGCFAFARRAWTTRHGHIDRATRTQQPFVDQTAIAFVRDAFAREKRDAIFVLPSPDAACILPAEARILTNHIEFETEQTITARTYRGKIAGSLYVVLPEDIANSGKGKLVLQEFVDYPLDSWERLDFGTSTIVVQHAASTSN